MSQLDDQRIARLLEDLSRARPPDLDDVFAEELFERLQTEERPLVARRIPHSGGRRGLRSILASRPALAAGGSFVLLVAIGLAGSLLGGGEDQSHSGTTAPGIGTTGASIEAPSTTLTPSTTTAPLLPATFADYLNAEVGGVGLRPQSRVEGDQSSIDVTFTDGRRVQILYPTGWPLDEFGWSPSTDVVYDLEEPRQDGTGFLYAQVIFSYGADEEWSIRLEPQSIWTDSELALAMSQIQVDEEENGFVTITTSRPFAHYTQVPDQAPLAEDFKGRTPWIDVGDILGLTATGACVEDPEHPFPMRDPFSITWCDEDAGVILSFAVPEIYHDEILNGVDARLVTAGPGS